MSTHGNNNSNNGDGDGTKCRDEVKSQKKQKTAMGGMVESTELFLGLLLSNPGLLEKPRLGNIRKYLLDISSKHASLLSPPIGWGATRDVLTKDIASDLQNRNISSPLNNAISLQITHRDCIEVKGTSIGINEHSNDIVGTRKKWRFTAVDGSNGILLLRIDSTLNTAAMSLDPGSIAEITSSFPVYFNYEDDNDDRCAIVVQKFEIIGKRDVPEDLPKNNKKAIRKKRLKTEEVPTSHNDPSTKEQPCCNGSLCSKHGVSFDLCISELIPPETVPLPLVARECVFTTMEMKYMQPNHKRFLLYYYYATTIYQFHGAGNRVELPECLIYAIRKLYPRVAVDMSNVND